MKLWRRIRKAARDEGFRTVGIWICFYYASGYRLLDLYYHFMYTTGIDCKYDTFYKNIIPYMDLYISGQKKLYSPAIRRALYNGVPIVDRIKEVDREIVFANSTFDAFKELEKYGFTREQIRYLMRKRNRRRKVGKDGFTNIRTYWEWQRRLREHGFINFQGVLNHMKKHQITLNAMAKSLGVDYSTLRFRISKYKQSRKY